MTEICAGIGLKLLLKQKIFVEREWYISNKETVEQTSAKLHVLRVISKTQYAADKQNRSLIAESSIENHSKIEDKSILGPSSPCAKSPFKIKSFLDFWLWPLAQPQAQPHLHSQPQQQPQPCILLSSYRGGFAPHISTS